MSYNRGTMGEIVVGGIIRDREWCAERWLDAIYKSYEYYKNNTEEPLTLRVVVVDDDSQDKTIDIVSGKILVGDSMILAYVPNRIDGSVRGTYSFERLAYLRNLLYSRAFRVGCEKIPAQYLFSVDSDVIISEDCLYKLITSGKDIVAAPVRNSTNENVLNFLMRVEETQTNKLWVNSNIYTRYIRIMEKIIPGYPHKLPELFEVGLTGACILISKAAHALLPERPYSADDSIGMAEDVGFANACYTAGVQQWIRSDIKTIHLYDKSTELVPVHMENA